MENNEVKRSNFIKNYIEEDLKNGRFTKVHTRFPPEPSGYLHIGHAKAIVTSFTIAQEFGGLCNLRFDDTNPLKEESEFEEAIKKDIKWLGFDWEDRLFYASDYFETLYGYAIKLIKAGKAYVCDLNPDEMREYRGTLSRPGKNSPYRERSIEENIKLFEKMRAGEFKEGACVLRAKIDMASPNINLRDPIMYRILYKSHHRVGDKWCIYPSYDFTHGQSDSIEGVSHSLCDLNFENHRPLYDWFCEELEIHHPRQIEFARLNLTYTMMSKRFLKELVEKGFVDSWDDPRLPTLRGMRRKGFTPQSIKSFVKNIGLAKQETIIEHSVLEYELREDLKKKASHRMAVLRPLKIVLENFPADKVEEYELDNNPNNEEMGTRTMRFSRELYIDHNDFMEEAPKKFFRLTVGSVVKLRGGYIIRCNEALKDENGEITELRCEYYPETKNEIKLDGKKVKGIIHWVSSENCINAEVRIFDRLFTKEDPRILEEGESYLDFVNKDSKEILTGCKVEKNLADAKAEEHFQFVREGYFTVDNVDSKSGNLVLNKTIGLR